MTLWSQGWTRTLRSTTKSSRLSSSLPSSYKLYLFALYCSLTDQVRPLYQNVDANFSKIQQIMSNRILPAVKRYAVETESVRDAAKVRGNA